VVVLSRGVDQHVGGGGVEVFVLRVVAGVARETLVDVCLELRDEVDELLAVSAGLLLGFFAAGLQVAQVVVVEVWRVVVLGLGLRRAPVFLRDEADGLGQLVSVDVAALLRESRLPSSRPARTSA